jgi:2-methylisocitrate lyase-like PEP mutase family enzyme
MALDLRAQKRKAEALLSLHRRGDTLVLLNVWDPIGARILEKKGYPAVATASAALSASLGYQDGEKIRRSTAIDLIARVARSVAIPVTADIEMGYGKSLAELEETVEQVIESEAVGLNLEDSLKPGGGTRMLRALEEQCQRITKVRQVAERKEVPLVINARVDAYFCISTKEDATEEAVARAKSYSEAGADCIYPIGPGDEATIRILRDRIKGPINILASPSAAPLSVLRELGVNRVSFGPFVFRSVLRKFVEIAEAVMANVDYSIFGEIMTDPQVSEFLRTEPEPD